MPAPTVLVLLLLLLLALAELAVLVRVADAIGILGTLLALVALGVLGALLMRRQGLATLARVNEALRGGRAPVAELFDGACILVAGLLLAFPGLLSDAAACALLLPPLRRLLYKAVASRARATGAAAAANAAGGGRPSRPGGRTSPGVIEGEYEEIEPVAVSDERDERRRG